jgi:hypothetical protein
MAEGEGCLMAISTLLLVCVLLVGRSAVAASAEPVAAFEVRAVLAHLGHVRTLAQRIGRQNLLAQTQLAEGQRPAMARSAGEMDALLRMLSEGEVMLSIPAPPTPELTKALEAVDAAWSPLRTLAVSSPYDYPRRLSLEGHTYAGDPLYVLHADVLASDLDERTVVALNGYQGFCKSRGFADCGIDSTTSAPGALERLAKSAVFVFAEIDPDARRKQLRAARDECARILEASIDSPRARAAMSPVHGTSGELIGDIAGRIEEDWEILRSQVDRLLEGQDGVDLAQLLETQSELLYSLQRLATAQITIGTPLAVSGASGAKLFRYEHIAAQRQLGRLRVLMERMNKDNLLYRLRIEDSHQPRAHAIAAAAEVDQAFIALRQGDPRTGVPRPPNPEIEPMLAEIEQEWTPIRRLAESSPFDYLRRSRLIVDPSDEPDPLALRYFDRRISELVGAVDRTSEIYTRACTRDGYALCEKSADSGRAGRLSEQLVKQALLYFAGAAPRDGLERKKDEFDHFMASPTGRPDLDQPMPASSAPESLLARAVIDVLAETRSTWSDLRRELELVSQGSALAPNLERAIALQRRMALELDRLGVAVARLDLFESAVAPSRQKPSVASPPRARERTAWGAERSGCGAGIDEAACSS